MTNFAKCIYSSFSNTGMELMAKEC